MADESKPASTGGTASDRLAREPLDRLLTRVSVEQRATLAYLWANRAIRSHAAAVLDGNGMGPQAGQLRGLTEIKDDATAGTARDLARTVQQGADAARTKEESSGKSGGPATKCSQAMSYAVASVQAALGQTGLKVTTTGGVATQPTQVQKAAVDTGVNRALLAGKYGANILTPASDAAAAEDAAQRAEVLAILKAPKRIA